MAVTGPQRGRTTTAGARSGGVGLDVLPLTHAAGIVAAFQAAAGSLVVVLVPVVVTWVVTGGGTASWLEVVQVAAMFWLLAQHVALAVPDGHLALVPLGLAVVPLVACAYAGTRLARSLDPAAERIAAGSPRARPQAASRTALVSMAAAHGGIGLLVASTLAMPALQPVLWQAFAGPAVVGLLGGAAGSAVYAHGGARSAAVALVEALPLRVARLLGPVGRVLGLLGLVSLLALALSLLFGLGRVVDLYAALGGGVLGAVMITLLQLVLLPNLLVWTASVLLGPGFAIGSGTEVSPLTATLGPLPALPVLGGLPDPGPKPGYWLLVLLVPVLAGALGAHRLVQTAPVVDPDRPAWWGPAEDVIGLAVCTGVAGGVLAWLSGGAGGPGRLGEVGPDPLLVAGALAAEVALGAALLLLVRRGAPGVADVLASWRGRYRRGS